MNSLSLGYSGRSRQGDGVIVQLVLLDAAHGVFACLNKKPATRGVALPRVHAMGASRVETGFTVSARTVSDAGPPAHRDSVPAPCLFGGHSRTSSSR